MQGLSVNNIQQCNNVHDLWPMLQLVHERVRGFVKEVQAGGPSTSGLREKLSGNVAAPKAPGDGSQAAIAFREEERARQKACQLLLLHPPENMCNASAEQPGRDCPWCTILKLAACTSSERSCGSPSGCDSHANAGGGASVMPEETVFTLQAAAAAAKKAAEEKQRARDRAPTATIELSERFYARPGDLYECFTNPGRVQAFSQSPAQVSLSDDPSQWASKGTLCATG